MDIIMSESLWRTDREITHIYSNYVDTVYRIALMMLKNIADAEDATQTVFLKLMKYSGEFESDEHIKAWLIVTTQNTCRDMLKGWWRTKRSDDAPEQYYQLDDTQSEIWQQLTKLGEKYRLPIYLYYYEGYKTEEIAAILRVNHATIRTRLRTAKKKLKLLMEDDD